jgi:hypothetical protein
MMATEITILSGWAAGGDTVWIDWNDESGRKHKTRLNIDVVGDGRYDRPLRVEIRVNGVKVAEVDQASDWKE